MSEPKYIKPLRPLEKRVKPLSLLIALVFLIILIVRLVITSLQVPLSLFLFPELYLFWVFLSIYIYLHLRAWKEKIYYAENDIYETIGYRKKTSIKNIARIKDMRENMVEMIIERLIAQEKLFGVIKDGLYMAERTMNPICSLCNKDIEDPLLMVLCPYCKRPFHKDHIIDYLNEMEEKCPNCEVPLKLGDIIK